MFIHTRSYFSENFPTINVESHSHRLNSIIPIVTFYYIILFTYTMVGYVWRILYKQNKPKDVLIQLDKK